MIADVDGDGTKDVIGAQYDTVFALDGRQGGLIWNSELKTNGGSLLGSPLLADINKKDGEVDVVMATSTRGVLAIDGSTMRLIWRGNVDAAIPGTPKAADINNDGTVVFRGLMNGIGALYLVRSRPKTEKPGASSHGYHLLHQNQAIANPEQKPSRLNPPSKSPLLGFLFMCC